MKSIDCKFFTVVLCFLFFLVLNASLFPWPVDNGIAISTTLATQWRPVIVRDGVGGAFITWVDQRTGTQDIFIQRVNSEGSTLWTPDGVAISTALNDQYYPKIINDGSGGAAIVWQDSRNGLSNIDIYAQSVDSTGTPLWILDGIAICTSVNNQENPTIISDDAGGSIITWEDSRDVLNKDIYAQRLDSSGSPLWTLEGIAVCTAQYDQVDPNCIQDGAGGAFIAWNDGRNGLSDIFLQRVNSLGSTLWVDGGIAVCSETDIQRFPIMTTDGIDGIIIIWEDKRDGNYDIYAQRVNSNGSTLWTVNGLTLCTQTNNQFNPTLVSDGLGGAIVTWEDTRNGNYDIYAQRVNGNGSTLWITDGITVCNATITQSLPKILSDDANGAIITWADYRNGDWDIYAQRVNSTGSTLWAMNGVALCTASNDQEYPELDSDGSGGAIITWMDNRDLNYDIYAQSMKGSGVVPVELSDFEAIKAE